MNTVKTALAFPVIVFLERFLFPLPEEPKWRRRATSVAIFVTCGPFALAAFVYTLTKGLASHLTNRGEDGG